MNEETKSEMKMNLGIARGFAGGEDCVVSHADAGGPCGRPGNRMVWELAFCEVHGAEAEAAALAEITEDAEIELQALRGAENSRLDPERDHEKALLLAYPLIEGRADPTVTNFNYEAKYSGDRPVDGPVDWWAETRYLLCQFMREANGQGLPELVRELEALRERASAQLVQAEDDYERRYVAPYRAAREASTAGS
jgi:hypothetical protein